jgi:hypothetical protein
MENFFIRQGHVKLNENEELVFDETNSNKDFDYFYIFVNYGPHKNKVVSGHGVLTEAKEFMNLYNQFDIIANSDFSKLMEEVIIIHKQKEIYFI